MALESQVSSLFHLVTHNVFVFTHLEIQPLDRVQFIEVNLFTLDLCNRLQFAALHAFLPDFRKKDYLDWYRKEGGSYLREYFGE